MARNIGPHQDGGYDIGPFQFSDAEGQGWLAGRSFRRYKRRLLLMVFMVALSLIWFIYQVNNI